MRRRSIMKRMVVANTTDTSDMIDKIMTAYEHYGYEGRMQIVKLLHLPYQANAFDIERTLQAATPDTVAKVYNAACT